MTSKQRLVATGQCGCGGGGGGGCGGGCGCRSTIIGCVQLAFHKRVILVVIVTVSV